MSSIQNCTPVKIKSETCCYKTTTEKINANYDTNLVSFPAQAGLGDTHIVQFNNYLVTYGFSGAEWAVKIEVDLIATSTATENYLHDQGLPADTWTINHNMNKYPSVTIINSANVEVIGTVTYPSLNQVVLYFNAPFSGKASLN